MRAAAVGLRQCHQFLASLRAHLSDRRQRPRLTSINCKAPPVRTTCAARGHVERAEWAPRQYGPHRPRADRREPEPERSAAERRDACHQHFSDHPRDPRRCHVRLKSNDGAGERAPGPTLLGRQAGGVEPREAVAGSVGPPARSGCAQRSAGADQAEEQDLWQAANAPLRRGLSADHRERGAGGARSSRQMQLRKYCPPPSPLAPRMLHTRSRSATARPTLRQASAFPWSTPPWRRWRATWTSPSRGRRCRSSTKGSPRRWLRCALQRREPERRAAQAAGHAGQRADVPQAHILRKRYPK